VSFAWRLLLIAGKQTVNTMFGTRVAVLAGDFLFAQASWLIANLENLEVRTSSKADMLYQSDRCCSLCSIQGKVANILHVTLLAWITAGTWRTMHCTVGANVTILA
jgi:hypothetical protein